MAQRLKKGIAKVGYAPITVSDAGVYTYGNVVWLKSDEAGGREYSAEPNGENTEIYADSISVYSAEENNGYNITLTLLAVIDDIEEDWLNNSELTGGGHVEVANSIAKPKFALILIENTTGTTGDTTIFFNCQVSQRPSKSGKTLEGNFEAQFPQYTISARPRPSDKWVCATLPQSTEFATLPELTITT